MGPTLLAEAVGGHALIHAAPWEWVLVFGVLVVYTAFELWSGRKVGASSSPQRAAVRWAMSFVIAAAFAAFVLVQHGGYAFQEYVAGYFVEYGLSVDNIAAWGQVLVAFVFFRGFHRKLLMFGALVSITLRVVFIFIGATAMQRFAVVTVIMGVLLIVTAKKLVAASDDEEFRLEENKAYHAITRWIPYTSERYGNAFVTRQAGGRFGFKVTPLGVGGIIFGIVDIMFAVDSVPAILSIAQDPYIIVTSNIMAVLGLMSLYFLFDSIKNTISKLNEGLAIILAFVGVKMLIGSELFWDVMWNSSSVWLTTIVITVATLYGLWLPVTRLRRSRNDVKLWLKHVFGHVNPIEVPSLWSLLGILAVLAGALAVLIYAGLRAYSELKHVFGHVNPIEVPSLWSLLGILAVLAGAWLWGRVFPEEDQYGSTVTVDVDHTGKIRSLPTLADKVTLP